MRKLIFAVEAHDLVGIIEESVFNDKCETEDLGSEDLANYWVNDILRAQGVIPVSQMYRHLDVVETYCTLMGKDIKDFTETLSHMIKGLDQIELGGQNLRHDIEDGTLRFYILRG